MAQYLWMGVQTTAFSTIEQERNIGMKNLVNTILAVSACVLACSGEPDNDKTNVVVVGGNTKDVVTNDLTWALKERTEIEEAIARAPEMMFPEAANVGSYIDATCDRIVKVQEASIRYRYFRAFMDKACTVRFEKIGESVPSERPDLESAFYRYDRKMEIARLESFGYNHLARVADQIFDYLLVSQPVPAPCTELFEPYFKFIEKMESEERRVGRKRQSLCGRTIDQVEYLFNFVYFKVMEAANAIPEQQDVAAFKARFKQVVGRPIRSAEEYMADSRRRTEANIREHRKQEEENRKALEFQKRFNKEHNIDVK